MALAMFTRNHSLETDRTIKPTFDELVSRVSHLAAQVARLESELAALRSDHLIVDPRAEAEPEPITQAPAVEPTAERSGRALMASIAVKLGKHPTGDTIRKALCTNARWARVREQSAAQGLPITRNVAFLTWLEAQPNLAEYFA